jgi:hypothetical protein
MAICARVQHAMNHDINRMLLFYYKHGINHKRKEQESKFYGFCPEFLVNLSVSFNALF